MDVSNSRKVSLNSFLIDSGCPSGYGWQQYQVLYCVENKCQLLRHSYRDKLLKLLIFQETKIPIQIYFNYRMQSTSFFLGKNRFMQQNNTADIKDQMFILCPSRSELKANFMLYKPCKMNIIYIDFLLLF